MADATDLKFQKERFPHVAFRIVQPSRTSRKTELLGAKSGDHKARARQSLKVEQNVEQRSSWKNFWSLFTE
jgi:hypothetical protein